MKKLLLTTALVAFAGAAHAHDHITTGDTVQFGNSTTHGTTATAGLDVRRDADSASTFSVDSGSNTITANGGATFNAPVVIENVYENAYGNTELRESTTVSATTSSVGIVYEDRETVTNAAGVVTYDHTDRSSLYVDDRGVTASGGLTTDGLSVTGNTTLGNSSGDRTTVTICTVSTTS